ncbi:replication-associated protein [Parsley severe stunt alphasatellite 3]|uniref:Replication-associated protein n=1 Tax=Parsley severe stunt alphasatellite 3 TaxID=2558065 RepID=A0A482G3R5_9VIRU|nr:replication-associated protein [Parsley severe stunt alphasatellite 3]QBO55998.1 replication-associated protein [Parsley severe stunt alphasatellite 3]
MACTNWVFTRNFQGVLPLLSFDERVQYASWQHERGSHDHIQGVIQLKKKARLNTVKQLIGGNPHLEKMRGTIEEASAYVQKEDTRVAGPWSFGEMLKKGSNKRSLMEKYKEDPETMELEDPGKARRCRSRLAMEEFKETYEGPELSRPWQLELCERLKTSPNDRNILWVYGPHGAEGKTLYAKQLLKEGFFYTRGGKRVDVTYAYIMDPTRHVVFDIPRDQQEFINYSLIEMFKDRIIQSDKYEPCTVPCINNIHVVVFANMLPDPTKISEDRYEIIYC